MRYESRECNKGSSRGSKGEIVSKNYVNFEELEMLCKPLVNYLNENYDMHIEITVSLERIVIKQDMLSIPLQVTD